jgi:hypothetical protein
LKVRTQQSHNLELIAFNAVRAADCIHDGGV